MSIGRLHLRVLITSAATGTLALALLAAWLVASRTLRARLRDALPADVVERILYDVGDAYFGAAFLLLLAGAVFAFTGASMIAARLERLRTGIIAHVRGNRSAERLVRSRVVELQAVGAAAELLIDESTARAAELVRERDELALLVNAVSEGILQIDGDGRVVRVNAAATELLGLPRHPRGQRVATLVRHQHLRSLLAAAPTAAAPATSEITLDGQRLLVVSRPLADGGLQGAVIALVDLTELRRLEGVRRDFVANVSHELKTPLTSIRGYVETLRTDNLEPGTQREFLDIVQRNADRLHRLVEDLLDLSRLESGGWRAELRQVEPLALAREVWSSCAERAAASSLTFRAEGNSLPAVADADGLRQVLANLFDNAMRHTPAGGAITVRAHGTDEWSVLEVQDTGTGIPRDALPRIFERFYRVDPARSRAEGGTGLGLSIVRHLVERMGGAVEAASELGKGTTIRVRLRAAPPAAAKQSTAGSST